MAKQRTIPTESGIVRRGAKVETALYGKEMPPQGVAPAIVLINPKYEHNVGNVVRSACAWGIKQVWFTGDRISLDPQGKQRISREERMKQYEDVEIRHYDKPLEQFPRGVVPVCVEIVEGATQIHEFEHPENAVYVFGPEDGGVPSVVKAHCHRYVVLPTKHCLNLASAVNCLLMHRVLDRHQRGVELIPSQDELLATDRVALRKSSEAWANDNDASGIVFKQGGR